MKKIIICSSFYESGRKYLDDFFYHLNTIKKNTSDEVILNVAVDDLVNPNLSLKKYKNIIDINLNITNQKFTITEIRNILIKSALNLEGDVLIFIDMDDLIAEDNIITHLEALQDSDISYGDMNIIDENKKYLNSNLFDNTNLPDCVTDYKPLLEGNFMGLSNTAIQATSLKKYFMDVPQHLVATDWWLYTMLLYQGCTAKKTRCKVASYRQHESNVLAYKNYINLNTFINTCKIAEEHFSSLPKLKDFRVALKQVKEVKQLALNYPKETMKLLSRKNNYRSIWFSEIFKVYKDVAK